MKVNKSLLIGIWVGMNTEAYILDSFDINVLIGVILGMLFSGWLSWTFIHFIKFLVSKGWLRKEILK